MEGGDASSGALAAGFSSLIVLLSFGSGQVFGTVIAPVLGTGINEFPLIPLHLFDSTCPCMPGRSDPCGVQRPQMVETERPQQDNKVQVVLCAPTGPRESCIFRYLCIRDWLDTVFPETKRSPALRGAVVLLALSRA